MKGCNLINVTLLILCASCTTENVNLQEFYKFLLANWKGLSTNMLTWVILIIAAACAAFMSVYGGIHIYRNGWRSLVPQSWRKTNN